MFTIEFRLCVTSQAQNGVREGYSVNFVLPFHMSTNNTSAFLKLDRPQHERSCG